MTTGIPPVEIERPDAAGRFIFVCEHASNAFPARWGDLGLGPEARGAHIAWDPGALGLARALAGALDGPLVAATASRLIYDLNRPPHAPGAMPARSETYDIPGNAAITTEDRLARTEALYLPFHEALGGLIAQRLARGLAPVLVTVHSFTPVWFGQPRAVELGVIHDADPRLAQALVAEARGALTLDTRLNEPYSAADGVTHTLARHATPMALPHAMIELRNDLIATQAQQADIAAQLAPCLIAALARIETREAA
ncbi:MAG: N-formylglutamate amidohydrolase [Sphingomonadales bacterium]|nr:N-formylglutamate amidohydrolase [Sphingomonadales bacterium]